MTLSLYDEFSGFGGASSGAAAVPGVELVMAANHTKIAVEVHAMNFPDADHYLGDVTKADLTRFPRADLFWASPACPPWSDARGKKRDFDSSTQASLFDPDETEAERQEREQLAKRRALMEEIPRYLRAMADRGEPVLGGVVENVVQCRKWSEWHRWLKEIGDAGPGYNVRVIALNAMHARAVRTLRAPQSRNRLAVAYSLKTLGRLPDWDKWLRPRAWCPTCDRVVDAVQVFKRAGVDMGVYGDHGQYLYRCPSSTCRNQVVHPEVAPATEAIDFTLDAGQKISERVDSKGRPAPLKPATLARIGAGLVKLWGREFLVPAGGTWRTAPHDLREPLPTLTTRETDGIVTPDLLVPLTARRGVSAYPTSDPMRTQTTRQETALVSVPPFISLMRGGGSRFNGHPVDGPLPTFSAGGGHHALIHPPGFLMPYYGNGTSRPLTEPLGTLTTRDRYALVGTAAVPEVGECRFRMLTPPEIGRGMAFDPSFRVKGTKKQVVMGYGNAVPPPWSEVIISALVECITGEPVAVA